ncbi:MAG: diphthine--ammonia ligase [Bacteroidetes bacterium]|nr:diphthine--ammonia ligase [Bacteroidota bacterium]
MEKIKAIFSWSGGKDSALCLHRVLQQGMYEVCFLLTTVNGNLQRVSMHGIPESLLDAQAAATGIPLKKVYVYEASNAGYERQMHEALSQAKAAGINTVIFGDIFLEDLRKYREEKLAAVGMNAVFPLWKEDTAKLVKEFTGNGFQSVICCVNDAYLSENDAGALLDADFVSSLPPDVDPCGENGEYHSFCFAGPIYNKPVQVKVAGKIYQPLDAALQQPDRLGKITKGFWYADVVEG